MPNSNESPHSRHPYLLLLHQLGVGAVIDDILAKDRSSENGVDLLSTHILELAVEDEVVSGGTNRDGGLLAEKNEGEDVTKLHGRTD